MINLSTQELNKICEALSEKAMYDVEAYDLFYKITEERQTQGIIIADEKKENTLNEDAQLLDKVHYNKERGYVIGQFDKKLVVMVQGNSYMVDPKDLKEYNKKPEPSLLPPMKFDEETQKLLFEQYVKCGVYQGTIPIKLTNCFVKYNLWEKAKEDQQVKVLMDGNPTFIPKSQIKIFENINEFANENDYVPGVIIDEATEQALENILINAVDYTNAVGDADPVRIIKKSSAGNQEMQTLPKAAVKTLAV